MQTTTIIFIILALLASSFIAFYQYYYKVKSILKIQLLLFFLKATALFLLFLLLINPTINNTELKDSKPKLSVLIDNSESISYFKENQHVRDALHRIKTHKGILDKFSIETFTFGESLKISDSLTFNENNTNVSNAILELEKLNKNNNSAVVLFSDGNQTLGRDYEYVNTSHKIFPVVFGDTAKYRDLKVSQINVNKYTYIKNKFPVEVLLNYEGSEKIRVRFIISSKGKTIFSKNVQFSKEETSKFISTNLMSSIEGVNYYTVSIQKLENEKNTSNNTKKFSVEVINEKSNVLIVSAVVHPDIGVLKKAIESNNQRVVTITNVKNYKEPLKKYQLVILYQPDTSFSDICKDLKKEKTNFIMVTGTATDWNFVNNQQLGFTKKTTSQTESYRPIYNDTFIPFFQEDIGFNEFAPLNDVFGEIKIAKEYQTLLYQKINGLETMQPLVTVLEQNNQKSAVIFGEGIWKWRATSFLLNKNFKEFDQFLGNFVQYTASQKKRNRLEINYDNIYPLNTPINITAFYTDKNYNFDARASLKITAIHKVTNKSYELPLSLVKISYQVYLENLAAGDYTFTVSVLGQNIKTVGTFKITDYNVEAQFENSNPKKLQILAQKSKGKLYYHNEIDTLIKNLLTDKNYFTKQKTIVKKQGLIDFKWILFLTIALFTSEWFLRKYFGKIYDFYSNIKRFTNCYF